MNIEKRLEDIVLNAYENVPIYYQLKEKQQIDIKSIIEKKQFEILPIVEKNYFLQQEISALSSEGIALMLQKKLIHLRTSGSTGKYMDIYWKEEDYKKSMVSLWWYRYKYYGILPKDKMCYFYSIRSGKEECCENEKELGFSKSNLTWERIKKIYDKMLDFKPKWLLLQPSIAQLLCECKERYQLKKIESIKYIELSGEVLSDSLRKIIEKNFYCYVANQYGAHEFNSIAYECPYKNMHVMTGNVFVESIKKIQGKEELVITTKTNSVMPLIRYRIGDFGHIDCDSKCQCKNDSPILHLSAGRTNDWIICENGERINAYVLIQAMDYVNQCLDGDIKQFQIIQKSFTEFIIHVVIAEEYNEKELTNIFQDCVLEKRLHNAKFKFVVHDQLIPDREVGKLVCFKSLIKE